MIAVAGDESATARTTARSPEQQAAPELEVAYPDEQLAVRMGIEITEWDPARAVATMPVAGNRQPFGLLHGGANGVLAETLGSTAAYLNRKGDRRPVGLELSCTHHRSATSGHVTAVCTPLSVGRTVGTFEIVISDDDGHRVCTAKLTCLYRASTPPT
jgi:1,4-dihydroxy-2-naphthoyl-CoA hydrolase